MSEEKREKREGKKFPVKKLITAAASVVFVIVIALIQLFAPFCGLLPALALPAREEGAVRLHFLSFEEDGDCTILEFSDGEVIVIDGGVDNYITRNKVICYLKGLHFTRLSLLLTHADADHFGSFSALLKVFDVERCYLPVLSSGGREYLDFLNALEKEGCPTQVLSRYDVIEGAGASLVCLSPRSTEETDSRNELSTVLYFSCGEIRALLCADIPAAREKLLTEEYALLPGIFNSGSHSVCLEDIDLLKAAHHGSSYSNSRELLELTRPDVMLISAGRSTPYEHPSGDALERYRTVCPQGEIYRTDELGDLIFTCHSGSYTITAREERG